MRVARRAVPAVLAVAALIVPAGPAMGTASASAESARVACGGAPPDEDSSSWPRMPAGTSANERHGPSTQCGIKGWADNRDQLDYHCWASGENGSWTYLRNNSDGSTGWVKDTLLPGGGAVFAAQCWA